MTIDGSRHPEEVPNWAAWLEAFRFIEAQRTTFEMKRRRVALDAQDRVLPTLEAAGQQALLEFVARCGEGFVRPFRNQP